MAYVFFTISKNIKDIVHCLKCCYSLFNITIEFMFAGINMFWARLGLILKMSLRRAQNTFMPKNINSITIIITLEGIEKIKTEKNENKTV